MVVARVGVRVVVTLGSLIEPIGRFDRPSSVCASGPKMERTLATPRARHVLSVEINHRWAGTSRRYVYVSYVQGR